MYLVAIRQVLAMPRLPEVLEIDTADGIMTTHNGGELREATVLLETKYVVKVRKIKASDYGSISHRKRVVRAGMCAKGICGCQHVRNAKAYVGHSQNSVCKRRSGRR